MSKHDKLPPIPSDEELAALAEFASENPDPRSTESEVAEAVMVAAALRAGGALTHGWLALKQYADA